MSSAGDPNYAEFFGIHSIAAAFVFAVAYMPFSGWFVVQGFRRLNTVYIALTLFCGVRVAAFILRGILASSDSLAHNLSAVVTYEILSSVGFVGLLFSAFILALDRLLLAELSPPSGMTQLLRNKRLFHLVMTAGTVTAIIGSIDLTSSDPSKVSTGQTFRKVGIAIFFVLTLVQAFQTIVLVKTETEVDYPRKPQRGSSSWGARNGHYILLCISIFLLVRETFTLATIGDLTKQNEEQLWYPFNALPEILAIVCYAAPGLVPARSELQSSREDSVNRPLR